MLAEAAEGPGIPVLRVFREITFRCLVEIVEVAPVDESAVLLLEERSVPAGRDEGSRGHRRVVELPHHEECQPGPLECPGIPLPKDNLRAHLAASFASVPPVTNPATTTGTAGTAFSDTFSQSGGLAPATFTLASGTLLIVASLAWPQGLFSSRSRANPATDKSTQ